MIHKSSKCVWLAAIKHHHSNQSGFLLKLLNLADLKTSKMSPAPTSTKPLILINQAMELLASVSFFITISMPGKLLT